MQLFNNVSREDKVKQICSGQKLDGRVEQKENNPFPPPRQSVRAVFPHTAFL